MTSWFAPEFDHPEAVESLTRRLQLTNDWSDDWAVEAADAFRLPEFCECYAKDVLSHEERIALMCLIIASLDNYLGQVPAPTTEPRTQLEQTVEQLLEADCATHLAAIKQWCRFEAPRQGGDASGWVYNVTPLMRRVWAKCWKLNSDT